jgi:CheY-like chemotaxis protein
MAARKKHEDDRPREGELELEPASETRPKRIANGELVLVVDDHEDTRILFREVLQLWGFRAITAENGDRAFELALAQKPRLVLMDLAMPGTDGWDTTKRFKAEPRLDGTLVVGVTGHVEPSELARAYASGVDAVVLKPIDPTVLTSTVAVLLGLPWAGGGARNRTR